MRLSRLTWAGIALIVIAVTVIGTWMVLPLQAPTNKPIDMPITMSVGHVRTPEFKVNISRLYTIEIVAKKTIPFETLTCLLGMPLESGKCDRPSVIEAAWTLTSGGRTVEQGASDGDTGGGWSDNDIAREIGSFRSENGRTYLVDVDFLTDASALSATDPHLKVEVSTDYYEGNMWMGFYLIRLCMTLALTGLLLIAASAARHWVYRKKASPL
jgi:hypothetical protein